jgi:murein DD-endopeptidase MepM/ murein hydrolase activator NlpD
VPYRAQPEVRGRHRRPDDAPHDRRRFAVVTAALVAGLGAAGVSAATASATPARLDTAAHAPLVSSTTPSSAASPATTPSPAPVWTEGPSMATIDHDEDEAVRIPPGTLSFARTALKPRPVPKLVQALALWVNPLPEAVVTSCFGQRWGRLHAGVDLAAPDGTRIRAAGAGVVIAAGPAAGYGNAVLIDHGNGFLTHYGHMSVITVIVGQHVAAGEQIGDEGSTGHSTGPHLHFEVHQGSYKNPIEPTQWMHDHGVDIPGCVPFTG